MGWSPLVMLYIAFQLVVCKDGTSSEPKYQDADTKLREGVTVRAIARDRCLMELRSRERAVNTCPSHQPWWLILIVNLMAP